MTVLSSPDVMARVAAIADLAKHPETARPALAAILLDGVAPTRARVWAMIALCQLRPGHHPLVLQALVQCLNDPAAIIRRSALETLGVLHVDSAVPQIAALLSDHTAVPEAWFDDDSTPSQAARRALEAIASPQAKAALAALRDA